tara:strand:- start:1238 stop:1978 length:741 start_codon:yes stop_codon:yes gene_type:complete
MIRVDKIYQRVLLLANKEQRGYITPQEFNVMANQAQMDIFEQYFYDLSQFRRRPGNDTVHSDMVDVLEEKIQVFKKENEVSYNTTYDLYGLTGLSNLYRISNVRRDRILNANGGVIAEVSNIEEVSQGELNYMSTPLTKPNYSRPVYVRKADRIKVYPSPALSTSYPIKVEWIRKPKQVNWTFVVVGQRPLYNASAPDHQDFELHPSEETELVLKILTLAGFTLKDEALYSLSAQEDGNNIQQEKI